MIVFGEDHICKNILFLSGLAFSIFSRRIQVGAISFLFQFKLKTNHNSNLHLKLSYSSDLRLKLLLFLLQVLRAYSY